MKKILLSLSVFLFMNSAFAVTDTVSLQSYLDAWRVQNQATSVVITIKDLNSGKSSAYASGSILLNETKPVSADNVYGVGSISKTFVATTLLQLQEEGRLKLDEPIGGFFPKYLRWKNRTIRELLNMSSGIPNFTESPVFASLDKTNPQAQISSQDLMDMAYAMPDYFEPGQGWHYSNTNYYLLGVIIEKITGQALSAVYEERFFKPLHLRHTFYSDSFYQAAILANMAHAYANRKDVTDFNAALYGPAGAMIMDSQDLIAWTQALFSPGIVLNQGSLQELMTTLPIPPSPPKPLGARYGLGIYSVETKEEGRLWYYTGVIDGYTSLLLWVPKKNEIIVAQAASWPTGHFEILFPNQALVQKLLAFCPHT